MQTISCKAETLQEVWLSVQEWFSDFARLFTYQNRDIVTTRDTPIRARGAFLYHAQICMSKDRIIVVGEVADMFAEALKECAEQEYAQADLGGPRRPVCAVEQHTQTISEAAVLDKQTLTP